jgi:hypothetical protein
MWPQVYWRSLTTRLERASSSFGMVVLDSIVRTARDRPCLDDLFVLGAHDGFMLMNSCVENLSQQPNNPNQLFFVTSICRVKLHQIKGLYFLSTA